MMPRRWLCLWVLLLPCLLGCHHGWPRLSVKPSHLLAARAAKLPRTTTAALCQQTRMLPNFSRVAVKGTMHIRLHTANQSKIVVSADARDVKNLQAHVVNGQLYLAMARGYPKFSAVTVDVYTRYLTVFSYVGNGTVTASNLRTSSLALNLDNAGNTNIRGQIGLHSLHVTGTGQTQIAGVKGHGLRVSLAKRAKVKLAGMLQVTTIDIKDHAWLSIFWLHSDTLRVRGRGNSFLQLAGIADRAEVELWDNARFYGRYLRAEQSFIKTHRHALAEIAVLRHQHTFATDQSNIYFYNLPLDRADFMARSGSVLDLRGWDLHYDPYNA